MLLRNNYIFYSSNTDSKTVSADKLYYNWKVFIESVRACLIRKNGRCFLVAAPKKFQGSSSFFAFRFSLLLCSIAQLFSRRIQTDKKVGVQPISFRQLCHFDCNQYAPFKNLGKMVGVKHFGLISLWICENFESWSKKHKSSFV